MSFVIQYPHSESNPSDKYRVTEFDCWLRYVNGASRGYAFTTYSTYLEALKACEKANKYAH
jgi:hypothetical protein